MLQPILAWLQEFMRTARETYGVEPIIFLVLYLACAPLWWYSVVRVINATVRKLPDQILPWGSVFLVATVAPFVYVLLFGHNLPAWVYGVIAILVLESLFMLYRRIREGQKHQESPGRS